MKRQHIDWHTADIIAGLRKKGTSLAAESRKAGLSSSTLANTLTRPWPKGELIIARVLGIQPWIIWPSRYHDSLTGEFIDRTLHLRQPPGCPQEESSPSRSYEPNEHDESDHH